MISSTSVRRDVRPCGCLSKHRQRRHRCVTDVSGEEGSMHMARPQPSPKYICKLLNVENLFTWTKGKKVSVIFGCRLCALPQWEEDRSRRIAMFSVSVCPSGPLSTALMQNSIDHRRPFSEQRLSFKAEKIDPPSSESSHLMCEVDKVACIMQSVIKARHNHLVTQTFRANRR